MVTANTSQKGLKDGGTRDTLILKKEYLEKIRAYAYWESRTFKQVIDEALGAYLKGKRVKPEPKAINGRNRNEETDYHTILFDTIWLCHGELQRNGFSLGIL